MLGPLDPQIDIPVIDYLGNSPSEEEIECLKSFLHKLRRGPVDHEYHYHTVGRHVIVVACNHSLKIGPDKLGFPTILDIRRDGEGWQNPAYSRYS